MKTYTFAGREVTKGIVLRDDEKLGQVVFLGEEGRGRRYEKISFGRRNPAEVVGGKVMEAAPVKITLPAKDGKPEKVFYVLEKPTGASWSVLARINTYGGYIRGAHGHWEKVAGEPEELVAGHGAFGDAGRVGGWRDSLVVMHPGDVIQVYPSRSWGAGPSAVWVDENGEVHTAGWQDYETMMAIHTAEATVADAEEEPQGLTFLAGQMPCFSFQGGEITPGFKLEKGAAGASVRLGEKGRGRKLVEVTIVGEPPMVPCPSHNDSYSWYYDREPDERDCKVCSCGLRYEIVRGERIEIAHPHDKGEVLGVLPKGAVADLGKGIFGLVQSDAPEPNSYLVRVCTGHGYTRRGNGTWEPWKGNPTMVTKGHGADGDAGGIGSWDDGLFILREGDVLFVSPSGDGPDYALFVEGGKVQAEPWIAWKVRDAKRDPNFYVAKGTAPWGHVPAEWVGRVVTIMVMGERGMRGGHMIPAWAERETGELISVNPFVLNLGWDGQDRHDEEIHGALWVVLTDNEVRRVEGEELAKRQALRTEAEALRKQAEEATSRSYFQLLESNLREQVSEVAREQGFDLMANEGWGSLAGWIDTAKRVLAGFAEVQPEMIALEQKQNSGELLVDFGGHFRVMGATNQAQYWVVCSDGTLRDPDTVSYRKRYSEEGDKQWRTVQSDELAISWSKAFTAAEHRFVVNKAPVAGCAASQLETVSRLEAEIAERCGGMSGMGGSNSPDIGLGWSLGSSKPAGRAKQNEEKREEENQVQGKEEDPLAALRKKWGAK